MRNVAISAVYLYNQSQVCITQCTGYILYFCESIVCRLLTIHELRGQKSELQVQIFERANAS